MTDKEILLDLITFLEKEESTTQMMVDSSIEALLDTGKISNRISSIKHNEKLKFIKIITKRLLLNKSK